MKRDMDLVRQILLAIEDKGGHPHGWVDLEIQGHTAEVVAHHVLLLQDAGLVVAQNLTTMHGFDMKPKRMTWASHEFLDAAKNDTHASKKTQVVDKSADGPV